MSLIRNGEINSMIEFVVRVSPDGDKFEKMERIVRCINCKRFFVISDDTHWCSVWDRKTHLYEFCSYGELKPKEGTQ